MEPPFLGRKKHDFWQCPPRNFFPRPNHAPGFLMEWLAKQPPLNPPYSQALVTPWSRALRRAIKGVHTPPQATLPPEMTPAAGAAGKVPKKTAFFLKPF